jgi:hypothetical protein
MLVQDYIDRHRVRKHLENEEWLGAFDDLLPAAAYGRTPSGFKHSHQQLLTDSALKAGVTAAREREAQLKAATEFETVFNIADKIMRAIYGLGAMWRYDFAQRIGAILGVAPVTVYVARGALRGARNLGLVVVRGRVDRTDLPPALRALTSDEVEDFLCIYKKHLNRTIAAEDWETDV